MGSRRGAAALLCAGLVWAGASACDTARVAPPGEPGAGESGRFALVEGMQGRARMAVTGRRWAVPPQHVLLHHSALWVELTNRSAQRLRFRAEDFRLRIDLTEIGADDPLEMVRRGVPGSVEESRVLRTTGLGARTLAPGETARGFVFFRYRFSADATTGPVTLRLTVFDEEHETEFDRIEVPLEVTR